LETGDALVAELNQALNEISEHPQRWKRILENIQSYGPTKKFKWRIVYVEQAQEIFISGAEDPLYWIERLAS
jgi:hypothetical protein